MRFKALSLALIFTLCLGVSLDAEARKKKTKKRRYSGPPPTHPVVLWSRTLSESTDAEQRKVAAFKLSQYSQPIYQASVVDTLVKCMKDSDLQIKVLCTKAMARAGTQSTSEYIRKVLLEQYKKDDALKATVVRVFIARKDSSSSVHDTLLETIRQKLTLDDMLVHLGYFEEYGNGSNKFIDTLAEIFTKNDNAKLKRAVAKALGSQAQGQDKAVDILAGCADSKDTPLSLTCLAGLQAQTKKDKRAWTAVEKTIESTDPDVLEATLDVITALPETENVKIATRLLEIIDNSDDADIQEKAVLALGVCGHRSEAIANALETLIDYDDTDESTRIASALVLGKQAPAGSGKSRNVLSKCVAESKSVPLRTACQLGLQELDGRNKAAGTSSTVSGETSSKTIAKP